MNVFVDTNILFTFYNLSSESLDELRKVIALHKRRQHSIWIPEQVVDEFYRNRENVLANAISEFKKNAFALHTPQLVRYVSEIEELIELTRRAKHLKEEIVQAVQSKIDDKTLDADYAVDEIFQAANIIPRNDGVVNEARLRFDLGNPPGKKGSYGDAVNWLSLLEAVPNGDLHIITDDEDYISPLYPDEPNEFLRREWARKKAGRLLVYKRLSRYVARNHPGDVHLEEIEKMSAIDDLVSSGSFRSTHQAIAQLREFQTFTDEQAQRIADAYIHNHQVNWIADDDDLLEFGRRILTNHGDSLGAQRALVLADLVGD